MPSRQVRKAAYTQGYNEGFFAAMQMLRDTTGSAEGPAHFLALREMETTARGFVAPTKKRKLSAWNKFVKANSKKKEFRYANGKLKLKKMGIAFRKKRR